MIKLVTDCKDISNILAVGSPKHRIIYCILLTGSENPVNKKYLNVIQIYWFSSDVGLQFGESHVIST